MTSRSDVADFYIVVREVGSSKSIIERDLVYKERSFTIKGNVPEFEDTSTKYELCVLARDSIGNVKNFRSSQCQVLMKNPGHGSSGNSKTTSTVTILVLPFVLLMNILR